MTSPTPSPTALPTLPALVTVLVFSLVITVIGPPPWQPWAQFVAAGLIAVSYTHLTLPTSDLV